MKLDQEKSKTISDKVYEVVKENIINLELPPGELISEKEISTMLGVSRTPVRAAFDRLVQEGLIEVFPQKGTRISLIDLKSVKKALYVRSRLEMAAIDLLRLDEKGLDFSHIQILIGQQTEAIQNGEFYDFFKLDERFHEALIVLSGNLLIWEAIQKVDSHLKRMRVLALTNKSKFKSVMEEHRNLLHALEAKEYDEAIKILDAHINGLNYEEGKKLREQFPAFFK